MHTNQDLVEVFDTTLRDGLQVEGVSATVDDKLRIAEQLDVLGVHYIEGGWPGSNPKDAAFFQEAAKRTWKNAKITAFGMTRRGKVAIAEAGVIVARADQAIEIDFHQRHRPTTSPRESPTDPPQPPARAHFVCR